MVSPDTMSNYFIIFPISSKYFRIFPTTKKIQICWKYGQDRQLRWHWQLILFCGILSVSTLSTENVRPWICPKNYGNSRENAFWKHLHAWGRRSWTEKSNSWQVEERRKSLNSQPQRDAICLELDTNVVENKLLWTWLELWLFILSKALLSSPPSGM